jgi:hypothetical protein
MVRKSALVFPVVVFAALLACKKEPPCKQGTLDASWQQPPLSQLRLKEATTCEVPATEAPTHARFWKPVKVHDANMESVDAAQDHGWDRVSDNWYGSSGDFNSPKWSTFKSSAGELRIDIKEEGRHEVHAESRRELRGWGRSADGRQRAADHGRQRAAGTIRRLGAGCHSARQHP